MLTDSSDCVYTNSYLISRRVAVLEIEYRYLKDPKLLRAKMAEIEDLRRVLNLQEAYSNNLIRVSSVSGDELIRVNKELDRLHNKLTKYTRRYNDFNFESSDIDIKLFDWRTRMESDFIDIYAGEIELSRMKASLASATGTKRGSILDQISRTEAKLTVLRNNLQLEEELKDLLLRGKRAAASDLTRIREQIRQIEDKIKSRRMQAEQAEIEIRNASDSSNASSSASNNLDLATKRTDARRVELEQQIAATKAQMQDDELLVKALVGDSFNAHRAALESNIRIGSENLNRLEDLLKLEGKLGDKLEQIAKLQVSADPGMYRKLKELTDEFDRLKAMQEIEWENKGLRDRVKFLEAESRIPGLDLELAVAKSVEADDLKRLIKLNDELHGKLDELGFCRPEDAVSLRESISKIKETLSPYKQIYGEAGSDGLMIGDALESCVQRAKTIQHKLDSLERALSENKQRLEVEPAQGYEIRLRNNAIEDAIQALNELKNVEDKLRDALRKANTSLGEGSRKQIIELIEEADRLRENLRRNGFDDDLDMGNDFDGDWPTGGGGSSRDGGSPGGGSSGGRSPVATLARPQVQASPSQVFLSTLDSQSAGKNTPKMSRLSELNGAIANQHMQALQRQLAFTEMMLNEIPATLRIEIPSPLRFLADYSPGVKLEALPFYRFLEDLSLRGSAAKFTSLRQQIERALKANRMHSPFDTPFHRPLYHDRGVDNIHIKQPKPQRQNVEQSRTVKTRTKMPKKKPPRKRPPRRPPPDINTNLLEYETNWARRREEQLRLELEKRRLAAAWEWEARKVRVKIGSREKIISFKRKKSTTTVRRYDFFKDRFVDEEVANGLVQASIDGEKAQLEALVDKEV